jgi:hypothetical protein
MDRSRPVLLDGGVDLGSPDYSIRTAGCGSSLSVTGIPRRTTGHAESAEGVDDGPPRQSIATGILTHTVGDATFPNLEIGR